MSYEEQCLKWVKSRFPQETINGKEWDSVRLECGASNYAGCPTCGGDPDMILTINFYNGDKYVGYKDMALESFGEYEGQKLVGFAQLLKEIVEA